MKKVATAYSMYFNKKYDRSGSLFEGRFKAKHTDDDVYLKYLFAYIHLNPIKLLDLDWKESVVMNTSVAKKYLDTYTHSSYFDYIGNKRVENAILNKTSFPDYFESKNSFEKFVGDWVDMKGLQTEE